MLCATKMGKYREHVNKPYTEQWCGLSRILEETSQIYGDRDKADWQGEGNVGWRNEYVKWKSLILECMWGF